MKCAICGIGVETIDEAIQNDWLPYFYEGKKEHGSVCSSGAEEMIGMGADGEMELKSEYCGKIQYIDRDHTYQAQQEDLVIEIIMTEEPKGQRY